MLKIMGTDCFQARKDTKVIFGNRPCYPWLAMLKLNKGKILLGKDG